MKDIIFHTKKYTYNFYNSNGPAYLLPSWFSVTGYFELYWFIFVFARYTRETE